MTTNKAKTFEEKINAILKYRDYVQSWMKKRYLPRFAYLEDTELESLLALGREIEAYALEAAKRDFTRDDFASAQDEARRQRLRDTISAKYPCLDAARLERIAQLAIFYTVY